MKQILPWDENSTIELYWINFAKSSIHPLTTTESLKDRTHRRYQSTNITAQPRPDKGIRILKVVTLAYPVSSVLNQSSSIHSRNNFWEFHLNSKRYQPSRFDINSMTRSLIVTPSLPHLFAILSFSQTRMFRDMTAIPRMINETICCLG
jgi:hypothetical protein